MPRAIIKIDMTRQRAEGKKLGRLPKLLACLLGLLAALCIFVIMSASTALTGCQPRVYVRNVNGYFSPKPLATAKTTPGPMSNRGVAK